MKAPERLPAGELAAAIARCLAGRPVNGDAKAAKRPGRVVWVDSGSEVLVHLDSVAVEATGSTLLVAVDLESDQTGRQTLVVPLALGGPEDPAGLVAVTSELPRGDAALAASWGRVLQDALWAALLELAVERAERHGEAPRAVVLDDGGIRLHSGPPLRVRPAR